MLRKAFKAFVIITCVAFAGCSGSNGSIHSATQASSLQPQTQTHTRKIADSIRVIAGDVTNCSSLANVVAQFTTGSSANSTTSASSAGSISALPGGSISALPGGSISALPGGKALLNLLTTCANNKNDKMHAISLAGGSHDGEHACATAQQGHAQCHLIVRTDIQAIVGTLIDASEIPGVHPSDLNDAYNLPSDGGRGQTVAIVDAYDNPTVETDLQVYRGEFNMPACTTANGCFRKIGASKSGQLPPPNANWMAESSLDVEVVSAVCPNCNILLVEANSDSITDLAAAEDVAAAQGATVISNSFYVPESAMQQGDITAATPHFTHPGIPITAASGDQGYGVTFPASLPNAIAVGGTSLERTTGSRGWFETAWSGSGSGCSTFASKPNWQTDAGCAHRTVVDVAAVGDPDTGVSVFSSSRGGWFVMGGTSVGAPLIAGVIALAGDGASLTGAQKAYANPTAFFPVTRGSNGTCASSASYLCSANVGYNGPTGMGTPNGITAF